MDINDVFVKNALPKRNPYGHKGDFGKVFCLCGSVGFTGAPVFASRAAVRTGSGLVYVGVPSSIYEIVAKKSDEAMPFPLMDRNGSLCVSAFTEILRKVANLDAVLVGCGITVSEDTERIVRGLTGLEIPLVMDADAISCIAHSVELLKSRPYPTVLTPHEGEFQRIWNLDKGREESALDAAKFLNSIVVLKGHETVVAAPDGRIAVNTTGNSGMAKGGSGDVLAGMIVSLIGQGIDPFEACCIAVFLHGRAGDICAKEKGEYSMTPTDMIEKIPDAFLSLEV